jgi:hypothetical protein
MSSHLWHRSTLEFADMEVAAKLKEAVNTGQLDPRTNPLVEALLKETTELITKRRIGICQVAHQCPWTNERY